MEYKSSYDRINNVRDIAFVSKSICREYELGRYVRYELIDVGYEDFNYFLYTENGLYVVKIFNKDREDSSCDRLVDILVKSYDNDIPVPQIYKHDGKYIYEVQVGGTTLKLIVMEYIGLDFWSMNHSLSNDELREVARIAAKINSVDYGISEPFYDEWTVTNLGSEYDKKAHCLKPADDAIISRIVEEFSRVDFSKIRHSYVHGDIIKANILLNKNNNRLCVIDFSAFNYLPRIVEITASMLGLCLADDRETTIKKMNLFLNYYNGYSPLDKEELEILPLMLKALASMYVIQASFINYNLGDYVENDYWLNQGLKFLSMNIDSSDLRIESGSSIVKTEPDGLRLVRKPTANEVGKTKLGNDEASTN